MKSTSLLSFTPQLIPKLQLRAYLQQIIDAHTDYIVRSLMKAGLIGKHIFGSEISPVHLIERTYIERHVERLRVALNFEYVMRGNLPIGTSLLLV